MTMKYQPSKFERVLILAFTFVAFALFATTIAAEAIQSYNDSVVIHHNKIARQAGVKNIIEFSADGFNYRAPLFNLITFPILLALIKPKRYVISTGLTVLYLVFLIISVTDRLDGRDAFGSDGFFTDPWLELWMKTSINDYFTAFVIAVLLIWQGSILCRVYRNSRRHLALE